ncbi:unnamed protein product, partial [Owenia fusiformis]
FQGGPSPYYFYPEYARIDFTGNGGVERGNCWCSQNSPAPGGSIEVDFGKVFYVKRLVTTGKGTADTYVSVYDVEYRANAGVSWTTISGLSGNVDDTSPKENSFSPVLFARFFRIKPTTYMGTQTCLSFEAYGCELDDELCPGYGLVSGPLNYVPDGSINATTSTVVPDFQSYRARITSEVEPIEPGSWSAGNLDQTQYIQVDLKSERTITGITTKGREGSAPEEYVTTYLLRYGDDGITFTTYSQEDHFMIMFGRVCS